MTSRRRAITILRALLDTKKWPGGFWTVQESAIGWRGGLHVLAAADPGGLQAHDRNQVTQGQVPGF